MLIKRAYLLVFLWVAIGGLGFTSVCFFDYNPKMVFVEITEEACEDGAQEDDFEFVKQEKWLEGTNLSLVAEEINEIYFTQYIHQDICHGYIHDMIKPPLCS